VKNAGSEKDGAVCLSFAKEELDAEGVAKDEGKKEQKARMSIEGMEVREACEMGESSHSFADC
jgi:hypothetical protein